MFQKGDNEINSYNSITKNQNNKTNIRPSKILSSSKILIVNDDKYQKNLNKTVILDMHNENNNDLNIESINIINNKNINFGKNDYTNSSKNLAKLPKIINYEIQTNSVLESSSNINPIISISNSIDKKKSEYTKHLLFFFFFF